MKTNLQFSLKTPLSIHDRLNLSIWVFNTEVVCVSAVQILPHSQVGHSGQDYLF